jgi:glycine hydroxymethyltransferase
MHVIAGKAVAFKEALQPSYKAYCEQIVSNASTLASSMKDLGYKLISGGTDTHLILIDLSDKNITGKLAEAKLEAAGITTNKNMIPYDEKSPFITSGIRIGTPALTTRGMKNDEMLIIADLIDRVLSNIDNESAIGEVNKSVRNLCSSFKLYENL